VPSGRKISYRAEVHLSVEHFDDIPTEVEALTSRFGGFVAEANLGGTARYRRNGNWTLRIPADRYTGFLEAVRQLGEVRTLHSSTQDVTAEYVDVEARLRNKRKEEERLLNVLSEATGKLEEVLAVEKELARVRGEIEQMEGRQRLLDDLVALSTVTLYVDEIKDFFPDETASYATRMRQSLQRSVTSLVTLLADLSILLVAALPWLAILLVPLAIVVLALRRRRRQRRVVAEVV
jgi:hypothetical protein